jgi:enoyl-CoA hydratase
MFSLTVADNIATLMMNNPPANAMSDEWIAAFHTRLDELTERHDWSVLHIRSALKIFCGGGELKELRARFNAPDGVEAQLKAIHGYQRLYDRIETLPRVTLAEINGAALGGGFEMALACDLRIAAHEARLGLPELRLGLLPGAGGMQRMTRFAGRATALRLLLGAEQIGGAEAERLGLVQWSAPLADLPAMAEETARRYAALPTHAVASAKAYIIAAATSDDGGYAEEMARTRELLQTEATRTLIRAFLDRVKS